MTGALAPGLLNRRDRTVSAAAAMVAGEAAVFVANRGNCALAPPGLAAEDVAGRFGAELASRRLNTDSIATRLARVGVAKMATVG